MDLDEEMRSLRRRLDDLAATQDEPLARYELSWPRMPPGFYWRLRWIGSWMLRSLEALGFKQREPWPVALRHHPCGRRATPVLIWGVDTSREDLRKACLVFSDTQDALPNFAPVLVTDLDDFAFYSRLGWLVEYLPALSGAGEPYDERKAAFLARLYRGAPAIPSMALLRVEMSVILRALSRSDHFNPLA